jgi:hypothetical protein
MPEEEWPQSIEVEAPLGIDTLGRIANQTTVQFTCPDCGSSYDIEVTVPWTNA